MRMTSRLTGRIFRLQPADTHDVVAERHVKVPMPDGLVMLAHRTDADSHHLGSRISCVTSHRQASKALQDSRASSWREFLCLPERTSVATV